jgi:staphylococcal nuclease domain-containing protein 1
MGVTAGRIFLPKDNQVLTLVLGGKSSLPFFRPSTTNYLIGIRAPRTARSASEKGEPYGTESAEFATRRYMQRDVEIEIETTDKSGGFIGALYLNKNENAAVTLVSEGLATVHSFSADSLPWSKQLYDAEVRRQKKILEVFCLTHRTGRGKESTAECTLIICVAFAT